MLNALSKGMRSFIAVVGCSGGREWANVTVDDSEMRR
jgi:hypothetical protein